jgi:AraC family transcriptional regulator
MQNLSTLLTSASLSVIDYRCAAKPEDKPFPEVHRHHSVSYVRCGSFGYRCCGPARELVSGSLLMGRPGVEFTCTHDHQVCGDECLSFQLSADLADSFGDRGAIWNLVSLPPVAEVVVIAELAQAAAQGRHDVGLDEIGLLLLHRVAAITRGKRRNEVTATQAERRRAVGAALWLDERSAEPLTLDDMARTVGLSPFHFLRLFSRVIGVTPHQYLVRARLRRAARLLAQDSLSITEIALEVGFADLSNFVRTFGRAAGLSPGQFRRSSPADRKILQALLGVRS